MVNGRIDTETGYFWNLCEEAACDRDYPHILILDEINQLCFVNPLVDDAAGHL